jgi:hypothetical protein
MIYGYREIHSFKMKKDMVTGKHINLACYFLSLDKEQAVN